MSDFTITPDHSLLTRTLWPAIFKLDGVKLRTEHIPTLQAMFKEVHVEVHRGGFPYVPLLTAPYCKSPLPLLLFFFLRSLLFCLSWSLYIAS